MSDTPNPNAPLEARPRRRSLGRRWQWLLWTLVLLPLCLAGALWFWASMPGSNAHVLSRVQSYLNAQPDAPGRLDMTQISGSLRQGGRIGSLRWQQDELVVEATGVQWVWNDHWLSTLLLQRHLRLQRLHVDRLHIQDQRPPAPATTPSPLTAIELPVHIDLPWSVDQVQWQGDMVANGLRGHYTYGAAPAELPVAQAHRLRLDSLTWADGSYRGQLLLGAQSPMPLNLELNGEVSVPVPDGRVQALIVTTNAQGPLATADAALQVTASVRRNGQPHDQATALEASALIRPWHEAQPLAQLDARLQHLDLAGLWPQAPTTSLSGSASVRPLDRQWQMQANLHNSRPAPMDQGGLPVQDLQLDATYDGAHLAVSALDARLGKGRVQASGQLSLPTPAGWHGPFSGQLAMDRLNPADVWSKAPPAWLSGRFTANAVTGDDGVLKSEFQGQMAANNPQAEQARQGQALLEALALKGRWQAPAADLAQATIQLDQLSLQALGLKLEAKASLGIAMAQWQGTLAADAPGVAVRWAGLMAPDQGHGDLTAKVTNAEQALKWIRSWQELPWIGEAMAQGMAPLDAMRMQGKTELALQWKGGLAAFGYPSPGHPPKPSIATTTPPPTLDLRWQAPDLAIQLSPDAPQTHWHLRNTEWRLQGTPDALRTHLQAQLEGSAAKFDLQTQGLLRQSWQTGAGWLATAPAQGQWTIDQLSLQVQPVAAAEQATRWQASIDQPVALPWQWRDGQLEMSAQAGQLRIRPAVMGRHADQAPASVAWERLVWKRGSLSTQGQMRDLPLAWLDLMGAASTTDGPLAQAGIRSDLTLQGQWNVHLPSGSQTLPIVDIRLERQAGELSIRTDGLPNGSTHQTPWVAAGLRQARLTVTTSANAVTAQVQWDTDRLGSIDARLRTELAPPSAEQDAWHWSAQAPLTGELKASLPEVGVWSALAPPGWRIQGSLSAQAELTGTRDHPQWRGQLNADKLSVTSVVEGIAFTRGQFRATMDGDRLRIEQLTLHGPGENEDGGVLNATGSAEWRTVSRDGQDRLEPLLSMQVTTRRLRVSNRPDRRLILSGQVQARLDGAQLDVQGKLAADSAQFLLPDETTPRLGDDVVIRQGDASVTVPAASRVQTNVAVDVDLGPRFMVRGQGLNTRLAGQLSLRSTPALPTLRVLGEVRTQTGSYRAYGQQLSIETGILRFAGPYDDPSLEIEAVRPNLRQRVGVRILGTAQRPQVQLFSDPELPDSEKLAWLVLGRPATGAGAEAAVLQQAALALLAGSGEGVGSRLAGFLGLDQLSMENRGEDGEALSLGKQVSNRLYLNYERGLLSTLGTVAVFYDVSRWLTLRARAGEENAIDLIFLRSFD